MLEFRVYLAAMFCLVLIYTGLVVVDHGPDLISVFFGDIGKFAWPGQFNLDFACFLTLAALWIAWRHNFTTGGFALSLLALGGMITFAPYLIVASLQARGDVRALLLGRGRA